MNRRPRIAPTTRSRAFQCDDELFDAFRARAEELACSVDWLITEAMQRLLAETERAEPPRGPLPKPSPPPPRSGARLVSPLPMRGVRRLPPPPPLAANDLMRLAR